MPSIQPAFLPWTVIQRRLQQLTLAIQGSVSADAELKTILFQATDPNCSQVFSGNRSKYESAALHPIQQVGVVTASSCIHTSAASGSRGSQL